MLIVRLGVLAALVTLLVGCAAGTSSEDHARRAAAPAAPPAISRARLRAGLAALERIANRNGGNRAAGTRGYEASADYVLRELRAAGYRPRLDRFTVRLFRELAPPALARIRPRFERFRRGRDFLTLSYSGSGAVRARVQPVDLQLPARRPNSSTSGCERADFSGFRRGRIALVQRGRCFFWLKAQNAQAAGARAVLVFNEGQPGRRAALRGTLGERSRIRVPVLGLSYAVGRKLALLARRTPVAVRVLVRARTLTEGTANVVAELPGPRRERVAMLGAHLDSVPAGPGINDNGSGAALVLEVARALRHTRLAASFRFAFWGARGARAARLDALRRCSRARGARANRRLPQLRHGRLAELRPVRLFGASNVPADSAGVPERVRAPRPARRRRESGRSVGSRAVRAGRDRRRRALHRGPRAEERRGREALRRDGRQALRPVLPPRVRRARERQPQRPCADDGSRGRGRGRARRFA